MIPVSYEDKPCTRLLNITTGDWRAVQTNQTNYGQTRRTTQSGIEPSHDTYTHPLIATAITEANRDWYKIICAYMYVLIQIPI